MFPPFGITFAGLSAYAARCARRVQPICAIESTATPHHTDSFADAVDNAISAAEAYAEGRPPHDVSESPIDMRFYKSVSDRALSFALFMLPALREALARVLAREEWGSRRW